MIPNETLYRIANDTIRRRAKMFSWNTIGNNLVSLFDDLVKTAGAHGDKL